jgi:hypothetical protein
MKKPPATTDFSRAIRQSLFREDPKIIAKDAKGAKKSMKTSICLFYNILRELLRIDFNREKTPKNTVPFAPFRDFSG